MATLATHGERKKKTTYMYDCSSADEVSLDTMEELVTYMRADEVSLDTMEE